MPLDTADPTALAAGVLAGERAALARAITLVESTRPEDRPRAAALLTRLTPHAGGALRLGFTGPPGVGKSTTIDAFGSAITADGARVAVLAIDPSSARTGGSILGDKTRMARLSRDDRAFIRPSPARGVLGGGARMTRETILLCEAAGYDVVIVETVGVGQSETLVAGMVDVFVALMLPGAGDELQGIKKGLLEVADLIVVNKADGEAKALADRAVRDLKAALHIVARPGAGGETPVMAMSALDPVSVAAVLSEVRSVADRAKASRTWQARRQAQNLAWFDALIADGLGLLFANHPKVAAALPALRQAVAEGRQPASAAADEALGLFGLRPSA